MVRPVVRARLTKKEAAPVKAGKEREAALKAALAVRLFAELTVTVVRGVTPPTIPLKVMLPVPAVRPKVWAPFRVLAKVISPMPVPVLRTTGPPKDVAELKLMLSLLVVTLAEVVIPPPAVRFTTSPVLMAPVPIVIAPLELRVRIPVLADTVAALARVIVPPVVIRLRPAAPV